jgi:ferredoxin
LRYHLGVGAFANLACEACGASEARWRGARFVCVYCGATIVPRLAPGALCADLGGGCLQPAQSLCRRCARPLCDRHNDPKTHYWNAPLLIECLLPECTPSDAAAWAQLTRPYQKFPVPGVEGIAWVAHERLALDELGTLEQRIGASLVPLVSGAGGVLIEYLCRFTSLCSTCESEVVAEIVGVVTGHARSYRTLAFASRLDAIEADLKQARSYVEAYLKRAVPEPSEPAEEPQFTDLSAGAPISEWERCAGEIARRLRLVARLVPRLKG